MAVRHEDGGRQYRAAVEKWDLEHAPGFRDFYDDCDDRQKDAMVNRWGKAINAMQSAGLLTNSELQSHSQGGSNANFTAADEAFVRAKLQPIFDTRPRRTDYGH